MSGIYKLEIQESEDQLKLLLRQQKTGFGKERIQLLYLLKTQQAKTVQEAASLLGRHRATVQEWLRLYRQGGLAELLQSKTRPGRPRSIPAWAEAILQERLQQPQGFNGYQEICDWLETHLGIQAEYKTVHKLVHYRLQSSFRAPCALDEESAEKRPTRKKN